MNCLECGERLVGRSDKKFCNDSCRNTYNNKNNKDTSNLMRSINSQLRRNYKILLSYSFVENQAATTTTKLSAEGFNFEYFTQQKIYSDGTTRRILYDEAMKSWKKDV
ncbi:hypothetical protein [Chryseobacterium sp. A321]